MKIGKDLNNESEGKKDKLEHKVKHGSTECSSHYKVDMEKSSVNEVVEVWEVKNCLNKLKVGKARGPDGIISEQMK